MDFVPFNRPHMTGKELWNIAQAHSSGHLAGDGMFTARCQAWLERSTGARKALLTHSCTAALEMAAASFRGAHEMNIVVTRTFNLLGPGMPSRLFAGSLAAQIVAAERGGSRTINVGRLDSSRDYIDVRDAARAYLALAMASQLAQEPWVFNVCAGVSHSCGELADMMLALSSVPVKLDHDVSRLQSGDIDDQQGSAARLQRTTGWRPTIALSTSVRDTLDHARKRAG
jgi:nucleoside-diphosphate-sugar epimerase